MGQPNCPSPKEGWLPVVLHGLLNAVTETDHFPLPRIDGMLDQLENMKYLSKLDWLLGTGRSR